VAGIVGNACSSSRTRGSTSSTTDPRSGRSYRGRPSLRSAAFTVFFKFPMTRAITSIGIPSAGAAGRSPSGREVSKAFDRKVDAQRWLDEQTAALVHDSYVDPERSRLTVGPWAETWLAGRSHLQPKTLASYRWLLSTRVLPTWEGCRWPR
jgi:hypothetical protein